MTTRYQALVLGGAIALASGAGLARAQDAPPADKDKYVTREEYEKLKGKYDTLQTKMDTVLQEVDQIKKDRAAAAANASSAADTQAHFEELDAQMAKIKALALANASGLDHFLLTGDAGATFISSRGSPSTFGAGEAGFSPLFLWEFNDKIFLQVGMDFFLGNDTAIAGGNDGTLGGQNFDMSIADISYLINDYLTVDAGLFITPFGQYHPHFDPRWVNPLPDDPLAFGDDALGPGSQTGVLLQGAAPVSYDAKVNYAAYVTNGPTLITNPSSPTGQPPYTTSIVASAPGAPGTGALDFNNNIDVNNDKAFGGRIGFLPIPGMEFGYSAQYGQVNPANSQFSFQNVTALLQAVDFDYSRNVDPLAGFVTLHAEWIFSNIENATYGTGSGGTVQTFSAHRNGGYAQVTYRPSGVNNKIIKNTELVFRYDYVAVPGPPGSGWVQRYEPGIDYWLNSSTVIKLAFEIYDSHSPSTTNTDALMASMDIGF